jgi:rhamnogalacturonyl hydrolase YesR
MNVYASIHRDEIVSGMNKVWSRLASPTQEVGQSLEDREWVQGVGMYGIIKAYERTKAGAFRNLSFMAGIFML